ncbi:hypothetical protein [Citricoccus alkalitolerans]|uniref:DUF559 domain-containing protein n=1 Tax=Citricoccus alkalitolerans TaxID=246603 RepID=A0ABV8XV92_9MICC
MIDSRRDAWFERHGWIVIRITVADLKDDLRDVIRQVRARLAQPAGWPSSAVLSRRVS